MPATRSSARLGGSKSSENLSSSPAKDANSGTKRKASAASPTQGATKKGKKATPKKQATIEQTMDVEKEDGDDDTKDDGEETKDDQIKALEAKIENIKGDGAGEKNGDAVAEVEKAKEDVEMKDDGAAPTIAEKAEGGVADPAKDEDPSAEAKEEGEPTGAQAASDNDVPKSAEAQQNGNATKSAPSTTDNDAASAAKPDSNADSTKDNTANSNMDSTGAITKTSSNSAAAAKADTTTSFSSDAIHESSDRGDAIPSAILEKGIIYFFYRGSVATDHPTSASEVARSYIVLRPLPADAALGSGALPDLNNARLLALPKKVLPKSGRDRFLVFVEKAGASIQTLKDDFLKGSDYDTATLGPRHTPAVTPIGEGVYCITSTGRASHLAYMLTIPSELGAVQEELGLAQQGSFGLSLKNPEAPGPANASLPQGPAWPEELQKEFRGLRWMPAQPKHLEYANAQMLLIGEGHGDVEKAGEGEKTEEGKESVVEEMEKLEEEDAERVQGLKGDDAVFRDLKISHEEYPKLQTSW